MKKSKDTTEFHGGIPTEQKLLKLDHSIDFREGVAIEEDRIQSWIKQTKKALEQGEKAYYVCSGNSLVVGVGNTIFVVRDGYEELEYVKK